MKEETKEKMTPELALQQLKDGNGRFQINLRTKRNLLKEVHDTAGGQSPFATILHCIDSRVSAELIFDLGVGDVFSTRVAGNIVNEDILGSMEFANGLSTSRLIVVLGHTGCGAVRGAIGGGTEGNLAALLEKINDAIDGTPNPTDDKSSKDEITDFVNRVAVTNVRLTLENLRKDSKFLADLEKRRDDDKRIKIVGGMYDVSNGKVTFYD